MDKLKTKAFWDAAGARALRTVCQTIIGGIGASTIIMDVNWKYVVSASVLSGIVSLLTSVVTGLPEVE